MQTKIMLKQAAIEAGLTRGLRRITKRTINVLDHISNALFKADTALMKIEMEAHAHAVITAIIEAEVKL